MTIGVLQDEGAIRQNVTTQWYKAMISRLNNCSWTAFEVLCHEIMTKMGLQTVESIPNGVQYGFDIQARFSIPGFSVPLKILAECKHSEKGEKESLSPSRLSTTLSAIATDPPNVFILFTNCYLGSDVESRLKRLCERVNCILEIKKSDWIVSFAKKNGIDIPPNDYLGRMARSEKMASGAKNAAKRQTQSRKNRPITLRIFATFGSMSNIRHYTGKDPIDGLDPILGEEFDTVLIDEKDAIMSLLRAPGVTLKCALWPRKKYLGKYYTRKEREERKATLKAFLEESLDKADHRQIIPAKMDAQGNVLVIEDHLALVTSPEHNGFKQTLLFNEIVHVELEADRHERAFSKARSNLISSKGISGGEREINQATIRLVLDMLDDEFGRQ